MAARDLRALFDPRSVAIVGATEDLAKWGSWLAQGAIRGESRRSVHLVNRSARTVFGRPALRSLADLDEPVELVVIAIPETGFETAVDQALAAGARAIVAITAGLGETGEAGARREREVVARVREAGAVLLGPNCLGLYDAAAQLDLGSNQFFPGPIGLISQSGNLALDLDLLLRETGLGFSRLVSIGNQADLEAADLVRALAMHEPTRVIAVYLEDFRDGRAFAGAAAEAVSAGKPVLLLAAGTTEAGGRSARSHTGAMVSGDLAIDAACDAAGILRVRTPREMVSLAQALIASSPVRGRRLAVYGDGGGHVTVAADLAAGLGLELPRPSPGLDHRLAEILPAGAGRHNPVDMAGAGEQDFYSFAGLAAALTGSGEVDAVLLTGFFGGYSSYSDDFKRREVAVARRMAAAAGEAGCPLLVQTMYPESEPAAALRSAGVPVYRDIESALGALARLAGAAEQTPSGVPALPRPAPGPTPTGEGYWHARDLIAEAGGSFAPARPARTVAEALDAAAAIGYPVVLKALGRLHKSDGGGVVLGIAGPEQLRAAWKRVKARLDPPECAIEAMVPPEGGVELIVGARRDPRFGPVAMVGMGGVHAELLRDVVTGLAPLGAEEASALLARLRGFPLLTGARGGPRLAVAEAVKALARVAWIAAVHPEIEEIEINPLLVTRSGAVALDARLISSDRGPRLA